MPRRRTPGIFCLEGPWTSQLTERSSVQPLLELLGRRNQIEYLYDRVHTKAELLHLIRKWPQKQYDGYGIGYLAFHGSPGTIHLARENVTLDELGVELKGKLRGKVVHFGSCEVFDLPRRELEAFRTVTGAKAITGYREPVDWMQSAAFDLLFFDSFAYRVHMDAIESDVRSQAGGLARALKFTVVRAKPRKSTSAT
jgi:hypothetical protein